MTSASAAASGSAERSVVLPSPPASLARIIAETADPHVSIHALRPLIEMDPALSASLIGLANSAAYARGRETRSIREATVVLGLRAIRNLAVGQAVRAAAKGVDAGSFDADRFWEDSLRRGTAAAVVARRAGFQDPAEAFTVGLIQDLGSLALAVTHREVAGELQEAMALPAATRLAEERRLTGTTHPRVFVEVGGTWGIPDDLVEVVARHHASHPLGNRRDERLRSIAVVADAVADVVQAGGVGDTMELASTLLGDLPGRDPLELEPVLEEVSRRMSEMADHLRIRIGPQPTFEDLVSQANEALVSMNLSYEELTRKLEDSNRRLEETNRQLKRALAEKQELARRLSSSNETLRQLAATDELTGVANRRAFTRILRQRLAHAAESGEALSVIMLDIDHFKGVNDTHGHAVGDDVLRAVTERISHALRGPDQVGRLGGEEFGVIVVGVGSERAREVAERLRAAVADTPVACRAELALDITASFGGVTVQGARLPDDEIVLQAADKALYASKEGGRNRVTWVA